eukprot:gene9384-6603_t
MTPYRHLVAGSTRRGVGCLFCLGSSSPLPSAEQEIREVSKKKKKGQQLIQIFHHVSGDKRRWGFKYILKDR